MIPYPYHNSAESQRIPTPDRAALDLMAAGATEIWQDLVDGLTPGHEKHTRNRFIKNARRLFKAGRSHHKTIHGTALLPETEVLNACVIKIVNEFKDRIHVP